MVRINPKLSLRNLKGSFKTVFLDLKLSYDPFLSLIKTDLFIKPTSCQTYLLTSSNHPSDIFENIPTGIARQVGELDCSMSFLKEKNLMLNNTLYLKGVKIFTLKNILNLDFINNLINYISNTFCVNYDFVRHAYFFYKIRISQLRGNKIEVRLHHLIIFSVTKILFINGEFLSQGSLILSYENDQNNYHYPTT
ncbi:hypothetical protein BpHYR1_000802 [Brachionus plicatilis]|uniref:Uncharacterized protein n=1 Tax=Brachionus plicatilis TaxID=10195 RepID=A0A3M7PH73_BRAPC|nr:hypothetical protein BpHYR1_000802 [Brachionus plicatilis]